MRTEIEHECSKRYNIVRVHHPLLRCLIDAYSTRVKGLSPARHLTWIAFGHGFLTIGSAYADGQAVHDQVRPSVGVVFILQRLLLGIFVRPLILVSILVFLATQDARYPARAILGREATRPAGRPAPPAASRQPVIERLDVGDRLLTATWEIAGRPGAGGTLLSPKLVNSAVLVAIAAVRRYRCRSRSARGRRSKGGKRPSIRGGASFHLLLVLAALRVRRRPGACVHPSPRRSSRLRAQHGPARIPAVEQLEALGPPTLTLVHTRWQPYVARSCGPRDRGPGERLLRDGPGSRACRSALS